MPDVELSAGTIEYEDTGGNGPTVVLVHGLAMDASVWRHVIAGLRADHRCVVPTLPLGAHRRPMHGDADLSLRGQARLLREFVEQLDLRDVTLVQNDIGIALVLVPRPASGWLGWCSCPARRSTTTRRVCPDAR